MFPIVQKKIRIHVDAIIPIIIIFSFILLYYVIECENILRALFDRIRQYENYDGLVDVAIAVERLLLIFLYYNNISNTFFSKEN